MVSREDRANEGAGGSGAEYQKQVLATAHRLNNLLMAISGRIELLEMSLMVAGPAIQRDLAEMRQAAEQAARLTNELLTFSRAQESDASQRSVPAREADRQTARSNQLRELRHGCHLLLVDDEPGVRNVLYRFLTNSGYRVTRAENGDEAYNAFEKKEHDYHLLLTDVIMPGMTGAELAQRIRTRRPDIKLVLMSGYTADCLESGEQLGEYQFLQKPAPLNATLEIIDRLLLESESDSVPK